MKYKNIETLYKVDLHPHQTSGPEFIIKPPLTISSTKPAAVKYFPQQGASQYESISEELYFDIVEVLTYCKKVEDKILNFLPNFVRRKKYDVLGRATRVCITF